MTSTSSFSQVVSRMSTSSLPYLFTLTVVLLCFAPVQSRWCTRMLTYTTIKPYVVQSTCTQSYQEACGFWTYAMCTRYEEVPCMEERNKTLTVYKIVESCCPGYRLNPLNNLTCEKIDVKNAQDGLEVEEKVTPTQYLHPNTRATQLSPFQIETGNNPAVVDTTTVSGPDIASASSNDDLSGTQDLATVPDNAGGTGSQAKESNTRSHKKSSNKSLVADGHDGRVEFYHSESDGKLFGLTKGAYAGIVCSAAFLLCVVVLVSIRLYKRKRNNRLKREKKQQVELEAKQSMMSKSEDQGIA